ncbi:MAG: MotA/TolQ/ExbB proton channel family protein [Bacteroidales bacterium]|mgnify:FL=1|jgi:biopolymer transport protein ExbB|nr:MotA/TolQ/ExbB proton channel family protein [Bacteroidales bacterium]MDX9926363.1 MotA/TolQ/ExbB proton channel family protein [Bacteroidales bacterium]HNX82865.1 MotA/TolQ/ExbB proton channel family protein [Bacteroidales bacterium]HOC47141.1 MotA/TolQ/ExbB proton channel family protein [Bacteroidales bacterium]HPS96568.1 MotA/TolQ/ExbB proton channel family protein [Bacteroidales bacterium]
MISAAILLQGTPATEAAEEATMSLADLYLAGGWVMYLITLLSFVALYIFIERYLVIKKASKGDANFMNRIKDYMYEGKVDAALQLCRKTNSPQARMVEKGITRLGRPLADVTAAIENVGRLEVHKLEKRFPTLATIAGAAPLMGFFGTVIGMVQAFYEMSLAGNSLDISTLSGGIYTALITTVGGLILGILAYFGYNQLVVKVENVVFQLETTSTEFLDILNEPVKQ